MRGYEGFFPVARGHGFCAHLSHIDRRKPSQALIPSSTERPNWCRLSVVSRESERKTDSGRLDRAIGHVLDVLSVEVSETGDLDNDSVNRIALAKTKLEACRVLVPLLERRSKLLGLDEAGMSEPPGESVLDRMTREIAEQSARPKS